MKFYLDFNRSEQRSIVDEEDFYRHIGATLEDDGHVSEYVKEFNSFEELEEFSNKLNLYLTDGDNDFTYSLVISFDPPCIYFDNIV